MRELYNFMDRTSNRSCFSETLVESAIKESIRKIGYSTIKEKQLLSMKKFAMGHEVFCKPSNRLWKVRLSPICTWHINIA